MVNGWLWQKYRDFIADLHIKNGNLPIKNGDFPTKNR
jgi:hypothetical protein